MKKKQKTTGGKKMYKSKKSEERKGNRDGRKAGGETNKRRRRRKGIKKKSEEDPAMWVRSPRCPWNFFISFFFFNVYITCCVRVKNNVKGQVQSPPTPTHLVGSKPIFHHMFLIIEILSWMIKICCINVLTKNLLVTTTGSLGFERERSTKTTLVKLVICTLSLIISIDR